MQLGQDHEQQFLDELLQQGTDVCQIQTCGAFEGTFAAMKTSPAYIYQSAVKYDDFLGYPYFLVRVEQPSLLGNWSYISLECKLALNPSTDFVIQSAR
ncbi:MAG: hypothetical protein WCA07_00100 [Gloeobacterales cyanobacterium]